MNYPLRVVVVGGGISGLAAANRLLELSREQRRPVQLTVIEAKESWGGVIGTRAQAGFLLEEGPDAFLTDKPAALALIRRIGLGDELLSTSAESRRSFIAWRGRLRPVPEGFYLIAPSKLSALITLPAMSLWGKLRMAREPFIASRRESGDESIAQFIRRRLGRQALERIGQPMIGGIYTADPEALSLQATFPKLHEWEREHGSLYRALRSRRRQPERGTAEASGPRYSLFATMRTGLSSVIDALTQRLAIAERIRGHAAESLTRTAGGWRVQLNDGRALEADAVILAIPSYRAAELFKVFAPELHRALDAIDYATVAVAHFGFRAADMPALPAGFGFVVPAVESRGVVGCTFTSMKFPGRAPAGHVLVRAFVGGAMHRGVVSLDDARLLPLVREELRRLVGIKAEPVLTTIRRFHRAMPQYAVGHLDRVAAIERMAAGYPGVHLTGNAYRGIGIPDCIRQAEAAAERLMTLYTTVQATTNAGSDLQPLGSPSPVPGSSLPRISA